MKKILLIGDPVSHSLSPKMQNAAIQALGLDLKYESLRISKEKFEAEIERILSDRNILGANITAPFKTRILSFIEASESAVNTIKRGSGNFKGFNTDIYGIKRFLIEIGFSKNMRGCVLGSGGAAIAAREAIRDLGGRVEIISRKDCERQNIETLVARSEIVINATGRDDFAFDWGKIPRETTAIDLRYSPLKPLFLQNAEETGHRIFNGLKILLYQGSKSFEIWTGREAPLDVMSKAIGLS